MEKKIYPVQLTYLSILNGGIRDDSKNMNNTNYENVIDFNEQMEKSGALIKFFSNLKKRKCIYNNVNLLVQFDINYHIDLSVIEGIMSHNRDLVSFYYYI